MATKYMRVTDVEVGDHICLPKELMCTSAVVKAIKPYTGRAGGIHVIQVETAVGPWKGSAEFALNGNDKVEYYPEPGLLRRIFASLVQFVQFWH